MNQNEKDIFDSIDSFFTDLNLNELGKKVQKNAESLSKEINESLKQNGYDTVTEFIAGEILDKKGQKPQLSPQFKEIQSRVEFTKNALIHVDYDLKYRGYFKEGHQEAIQHGLQLIAENQNDLDLCAHRIQDQLNEIKHHRSNKKDAFQNGYIQGCQFILNTILESKKRMMKKILREIQI